MDLDGDTSPPPDQYARDNHLSIDSQISPFSLLLQADISIPEPTPDTGLGGLTSDALLPRLQLPAVDFRQQLDVSRESIDLLTKAIEHDGIDVSTIQGTPLAHRESRRRLAELKLDPPALFSDPDYDCRELAQTIREQRQPNNSPSMFPSERLNIVNDEGLQFPHAAHQLRRQLDHRVHHEKLDVPREALHYLARALHVDWSNDDNRRLLEEAIPRPTFGRELAITPPLSPQAGQDEYFIPSAEVCEVPIMSDCSSMLCDDLKAAESALRQEQREVDVSPIPDLSSPSPLLDTLALGTEILRVGSIKMESPLLPITSPLASANEGPNIPLLLESMDIDCELSRPESSRIDALPTDDENRTNDHDFQSVMKESTVMVLNSIEQEDISIANAIARAEVPIMDFSIPEPEWQSLPMDARAHLKWLYDSYSIEIPPPSNPCRGESKLRWIPFLQKINWQVLTKETIDYEGDLSQLFNLDSQEVPSSASYVWKRPGLALMRELECEDDLNEMTPAADTTYDLASIARKRRLENDPVEIMLTSPSSSSPSIDLIAPIQHKERAQQTLPDKIIGRVNLLPSPGSNSAVSDLLSYYIDTHTRKRRKQDRSVFFLPTSSRDTELQSRTIPGQIQSKSGISTLPRAIEQTKKKATPQAPCPGIDISNAPTKLIKGLTLSRGLFSALEELYPTAEIIERDFDRWNTVVWSHHSISRSTVVSPLAAEADVIVSPATGIILTTLLKVIQKPLPGYNGQSAIRERISYVALRYERLVVLVSEGNTVDDTTRDLTASETSAYAEFIGFIAALDSKVEVFYVGGGEATLARWLVSLAVQYTPEAAEVQEHLIQGETAWEVFLRRAGLNVYAAQAILVRLKDENPSPKEKMVCSEHGLAAFMMMKGAERLLRFRGLMGGENVLNRVNKVLDMGWS
ncbi:hypothetical protein F5Y14DRAFT_451088 [Nemania sp. NC0429]|nr:hypothetical protein F5Y14DRAFT_451088 [Nemania sp. NC0429]